MPQPGDIWRDRDGQHSLILETLEDDGLMLARVLVLETGEQFTREPFDSWSEPNGDGLPYYRVLVA